MTDADLIRQLYERGTYYRARNQVAAAHLMTTAADRLQKLTTVSVGAPPRAKRRVVNGVRQVMLGGHWYSDDEEESVGA